MLGTTQRGIGARVRTCSGVRAAARPHVHERHKRGESADVQKKERLAHELYIVCGPLNRRSRQPIITPGA